MGTVVGAPLVGVPDPAPLTRRRQSGFFVIWFRFTCVYIWGAQKGAPAISKMLKLRYKIYVF
jgi:hypothetical protein